MIGDYWFHLILNKVLSSGIVTTTKAVGDMIILIVSNTPEVILPIPENKYDDYDATFPTQSSTMGYLMIPPRTWHC